MTTLAHRLDRTVLIQAAPDVVFRYFTDRARWAAWWGAGSTIDPRPGGALEIRYPEGTIAAGTVVEIDPPRRIVFTYGYASGQPIPPGGSRVTIELERAANGTRLRLAHELDDAAIRDQHVQGWRYQLSVFANVVADEVNAGAGAAVDAWFEAWADTDAERRNQTLGRIAHADVRFHDRFSTVAGLDELLPHLSAYQHHMPGLRLEREGDVRHCQGTVLADWIARAPDGQPRASGTNVFTFNADGRIVSVTGFMKIAGRN
jgi:uncharacterized protein YndB with AHSA1/START domain